MVVPRDRTCLPVEMELIPLYREPGWSVRLRRAQKREQRRQERLAAGRRERLVVRLVSGARAATRRRHTS